ncbi:MAG: hypothetical protein ACLRVQ_09480 [Lachnospiraceae bacterium]
MEEVLNILVQLFGAVMFAAAVALLLYYVQEYEEACGTFKQQLIKDTVIISIE